MKRSAEAFLEQCAARAELALDRALPPEQQAPQQLHAAMRYSVLGGGKRLRPTLVYGAGLALGLGADALDDAAVAVEVIHAYSLIHDDLPAMDDDDLRRGKPTCHRAFGEAQAILAGDALQALAFEVLAKASAITPSAQLQMLRLLAQACGSRGMAGGQAIDLAAVGQTLSLPELELMHRYKTGALIRASVLLGALAAGADPDDPRYTALECYGREIGLAFQIQDDLLDVLGDTAIIGKPQGSDQARGKPTYPALMGIAAAQTLAQAHMQAAIAALQDFGDSAQPLRELARYVVERAS